VLTTHTFPGVLESEGEASVSRIDSSSAYNEIQQARPSAGESRGRSRGAVTKTDGGNAAQDLMVYLSELCARPGLTFSDRTPPLEQVCALSCPGIFFLMKTYVCLSVRVFA
jgi:hypothetical protein